MFVDSTSIKVYVDGGVNKELCEMTELLIFIGGIACGSVLMWSWLNIDPLDWGDPTDDEEKLDAFERMIEGRDKH